MISFVLALISAFIFALDFFGVKWSGHSLNTLGLFFLALAVAFISAWPWIRNRSTTTVN